MQFSRAEPRCKSPFYIFLDHRNDGNVLDVVWMSDHNIATRRNWRFHRSVTEDSTPCSSCTYLWLADHLPIGVLLSVSCKSQQWGDSGPLGSVAPWEEKLSFVLITLEDEGNTQYDPSKPREIYPKRQGATSPKLGISNIILDLYYFSDIKKSCLFSQLTFWNLTYFC